MSGVYYIPLHSLANFDGVLTTGPSNLNPTVVSTFFSVFIGAALLMGAIAAFIDTGNNPATPVRLAYLCSAEDLVQD